MLFAFFHTSANLRGYVWIITNLAVRQYVWRFRWDHNLYEIHAALHLQITEV